MFPVLVPWAFIQEDLSNIDVQAHCVTAYRLTPEQQMRKHSKETVLQNSVSFALAQMQEHRPLDKISDRPTNTYRANPIETFKYCLEFGINIDSSFRYILDKLRVHISRMPKETEIQRLSTQRTAQHLFRAWVLGENGSRCLLTHIDEVALLRASHIKPWADSTDIERLDPNNGLLLAAHLDAAFDAGLITFAQSGEMQISPELSEPNLIRLGLTAGRRILMPPEREAYMAWHREKIWRKPRKSSRVSTRPEKEAPSLFDLPQQSPAR